MRLIVLTFFISLTIVSPLSSQTPQSTAAELEQLRVQRESVRERMSVKNQELASAKREDTSFAFDKRQYLYPIGIGAAVVGYEYVGAVRTPSSPSDSSQRFPSTAAYVGGAVAASGLLMYLIDETIVEPAREERKDNRVAHLRSEISELEEEEEKLDERILFAEYKLARETDTVASYRRFLDQYGTSKFQQQALERLHDKYVQLDTSEGYRAFLRDFPDSPHREDALRRLYTKVRQEDSIDDYVSFAERFDSNNPYRDDAISQVYEHYRELDTLEGYQEFIDLVSSSKYRDEAIERAHEVYQAEVESEFTELEKSAPEEFWSSYPVVRIGVLDFGQVTMKDLLMHAPLRDNVELQLSQTNETRYRLSVFSEEDSELTELMRADLRRIDKRTIFIRAVTAYPTGADRTEAVDWNDKLALFTSTVGMLHEERPDFINEKE